MEKRSLFGGFSFFVGNIFTATSFITLFSIKTKSQSFTDQFSNEFLLPMQMGNKKYLLTFARRYFLLPIVSIFSMFSIIVFLQNHFTHIRFWVEH